MALPKYYEMYVPLLKAISDGEEHPIKGVRDDVAKIMGVSEAERVQKLPSETQPIFANRLGWAKTYLKKAGLLNTPKRGHFVITEEGKALLSSGVHITNEWLMQKYPAFAEFVRGKVSENTVTEPDNGSVDEPAKETPQETFDRVYRDINNQLADELMTEILAQPPLFFERLVVDLMCAMGYGEGFVTKASGDNGVDGIIHEDRLGFNLIYIQAKRWDPGITIGKPDIQKFAGAMMGPPKVEKGLFITTAKFSQGAKEYANAQHIILVDGQKLTELMIEYGLGVSSQKMYSIKRIDSDYFSE